MVQTISADAAPAAGCLCAGTLHPLDAADEVRRRLAPLCSLLHIMESVRRHHLDRSEEERSAESDPHAWWDRAVPGEMHAGGEPTDLLLLMLAESIVLLDGMIRCVEADADRAHRHGT